MKISFRNIELNVVDLGRSYCSFLSYLYHSWYCYSFASYERFSFLFFQILILRKGKISKEHFKRSAFTHFASFFKGLSSYNKLFWFRFENWLCPLPSCQLGTSVMFLLFAHSLAISPKLWENFNSSINKKVCLHRN